MAPLHCYCLYGYGLYSYGPHSHGLYSYGLVMPHRIERQNGRADRALRHRLAALIRAPRHLAVSSYGPHCYGLSCIVMACAPHDTWRKRRGDESSAASQSSLGTMRTATLALAPTTLSVTIWTVKRQLPLPTSLWPAQLWPVWLWPACAAMACIVSAPVAGTQEEIPRAVKRQTEDRGAVRIAAARDLFLPQSRGMPTANAEGWIE